MFEQIPNTKRPNSQRFCFLGVGHPFGATVERVPTRFQQIHSPRRLVLQMDEYEPTPTGTSLNHDDGFHHV